MERKIYHLVVENRANEFIPIDINILLNNNPKKDYSFIELIDEFTMKLSEEELSDMIHNNNLIPLQAMNGKIWIINDNRYRYEVVYKDMRFSIEDFLKNNLNNARIMNKFINIYQKYSREDLDNMKIAIEEKNITMILSIVSTLDYIDIRSMCLYLYHLEK